MQQQLHSDPSGHRGVETVLPLREVSLRLPCMAVEARDEVYDSACRDGILLFVNAGSYPDPWKRVVVSLGRLAKQLLNFKNVKSMLT